MLKKIKRNKRILNDLASFIITDKDAFSFLIPKLAFYVSRTLVIQPLIEEPTQDELEAKLAQNQRSRKPGELIVQGVIKTVSMSNLSNLFGASPTKSEESSLNSSSILRRTPRKRETSKKAARKIQSSKQVLTSSKLLKLANSPRKKLSEKGIEFRRKGKLTPSVGPKSQRKSSQGSVISEVSEGEETDLTKKDKLTQKYDLEKGITRILIPESPLIIIDEDSPHNNPAKRESSNLDLLRLVDAEIQRDYLETRSERQSEEDEEDEEDKEDEEEEDANENKENMSERRISITIGKVGSLLNPEEDLPPLPRSSCSPRKNKKFQLPKPKLSSGKIHSRKSILVEKEKVKKAQHERDTFEKMLQMQEERAKEEEKEREERDRKREQEREEKFKKLEEENSPRREIVLTHEKNIQAFQSPDLSMDVENRTEIEEDILKYEGESPPPLSTDRANRINDEVSEDIASESAASPLITQQPSQPKKRIAVNLASQNPPNPFSPFSLSQPQSGFTSFQNTASVQSPLADTTTEQIIKNHQKLIHGMGISSSAGNLQIHLKNKHHISDYLPSQHQDPSGFAPSEIQKIYNISKTEAHIFQKRYTSLQTDLHYAQSQRTLLKNKEIVLPSIKVGTPGSGKEAPGRTVGKPSVILGKEFLKMPHKPIKGAAYNAQFADRSYFTADNLKLKLGITNALQQKQIFTPASERVEKQEKAGQDSSPPGIPPRFGNEKIEKMVENQKVKKYKIKFGKRDDLSLKAAYSQIKGLTVSMKQLNAEKTNATLTPRLSLEAEHAKDYKKEHPYSPTSPNPSKQSKPSTKQHTKTSTTNTKSSKNIKHSKQNSKQSKLNKNTKLQISKQSSIPSKEEHGSGMKAKIQNISGPYLKPTNMYLQTWNNSYFKQKYLLKKQFKNMQQTAHHVYPLHVQHPQNPQHLHAHQLHHPHPYANADIVAHHHHHPQSTHFEGNNNAKRFNTLIQMEKQNAHSLEYNAKAISNRKNLLKTGNVNDINDYWSEREFTLLNKISSQPKSKTLTSAALVEKVIEERNFSHEFLKVMNFYPSTTKNSYSPVNNFHPITYQALRKGREVGRTQKQRQQQVHHKREGSQSSLPSHPNNNFNEKSKIQQLQFNHMHDLGNVPGADVVNSTRGDTKMEDQHIFRARNKLEATVNSQSAGNTGRTMYGDERSGISHSVSQHQLSSKKYPNIYTRVVLTKKK